MGNITHLLNDNVLIEFCLNYHYHHCCTLVACRDTDVIFLSTSVQTSMVAEHSSSTVMHNFVQLT